MSICRTLSKVPLQNAFSCQFSESLSSFKMGTFVWKRMLITSAVTNGATNFSEGFIEKNRRLKRPTSPHLTIYKPQVTSMLSITHRGTGVLLSTVLSSFSIGTLMVHSSFPDCLSMIDQMHFGSGIIFLAKFSLAFPLMFHVSNGIRHLFWDMGYGFQLKTLYKSGYAVLGFAIATGALLASL